MLTGDLKTVADSVAAELGIDEVYSELFLQIRLRRWRTASESERQRKKSLRSSETESMMHRYCQEQISELQWAPWDQMQQSKPQISS